MEPASRSKRLAFHSTGIGMTDDDALREFGLPADSRHRSSIMAAIHREVAPEREEEGDQELIKCLVVQLFSIGALEDSLEIWKVKQSGFDLSISIDVQLMCGAGIDATKQYLENHASAESQKALEYLLKCIDAGDFDEWTPQGWIDHYRRYYGLTDVEQ